MTQKIEAIAASGLTGVIFKIFAAGSDILVDSETATEETNRKSMYSATFTDLPAATYRLFITTSTGVALANWAVDIEDAAATYQAYEAITLPEAEVDLSPVVDLINSKLSTVTYVSTAQVDASTLDLTAGDAYDDQANSALVWDVGKDISAATANFTIRNLVDDIILDTDSDGVTATTSGTNVSVQLSSAATRLLGCDEYKFDVEVVYSADSKQTIANGICTVTLDQSR